MVIILNTYRNIFILSPFLQSGLLVENDIVLMVKINRLFVYNQRLNLTTLTGSGITDMCVTQSEVWCATSKGKIHLFRYAIDVQECYFADRYAIPLKMKCYLAFAGKAITYPGMQFTWPNMLFTCAGKLFIYPGITISIMF